MKLAAALLVLVLGGGAAAQPVRVIVPQTL